MSSVDKVLDEILEKAAPGFCHAIVTSSGPVHERIDGYRRVLPDIKPMDRDTYFDMASISKILGPTMLALVMHRDGKLGLDERIGSFFPNAGAYKDMTIMNLATHTAGFRPDAPLWTMGIPNRQVFETILDASPSYVPGKGYEYSCLGYIIMAHMLELVLDKSLQEACSTLFWNEIGMTHTTYTPPKDARFAATELKEGSDDECYEGIIHDENARFMMPMQSGNAGVFSTLEDMEVFCSFILSELKRPSFFTHEETYLMSHDLTPKMQTSRAFGFMLGRRGFESLAGHYCSPDSFGHTGFTGTSIWIDPKKDRAAVLLTNRVHPSRTNTNLLSMRGTYHDAVFGGES